jgi:hypothetical protein
MMTGYRKAIRFEKNRLHPQMKPSTGQKSASGKSNIRGTESGNIVPGAFAPVLAKHSPLKAVEEYQIATRVAGGEAGS